MEKNVNSWWESNQKFILGCILVHLYQRGTSVQDMRQATESIKSPSKRHYPLIRVSDLAW